MSFQINNIEENKIIVNGGLSTEITFAKYVANRTDKIYYGWENNVKFILILFSTH